MREGYELYKADKSLKPQDIKMVGACGFEPQTPTVSIPDAELHQDISSEPE